MIVVGQTATSPNVRVTAALPPPRADIRLRCNICRTGPGTDIKQRSRKGSATCGLVHHSKKILPPHLIGECEQLGRKFRVSRNFRRGSSDVLDNEHQATKRIRCAVKWPHQSLAKTTGHSPCVSGPG